MLHLIVYVLLGSRCEFFIWNDEPTNEFSVIALNVFKREVLHLIPILSRDRDKMCFSNEVEA